jgi:hypothetical protein
MTLGNCVGGVVIAMSEITYQSHCAGQLDGSLTYGLGPYC